MIYNSSMTDYRRRRVEGGTYFFTLVTFERNTFLTTPEARDILHEAWMFVMNRQPFTTEAICLLPDHIHCIWTLPEGDSDYSTRWKEIKRRFSHHYRDACAELDVPGESRQKKMEQAFWQRRFWEHTIHGQEDYDRHVDYIHYNPVKHGLTASAGEWEWSSFRRFVQQGYYGMDWGRQGIEVSVSEKDLECE
jgi:putative transposase